jgi:hypothetical protein
LIFVVVRGALGVILLSDISFKTTYPEVYSSGITQAGLAPLNVSVTTIPDFNSDATAEFWWYFPSLMTDTARVTTIPPLTCSTPPCLSYFLPGSMGLVILDPELPPIGKNNFSDATAFIVNDAPGYQIEFTPVTTEDLPLEGNDCKIYGIPGAALQICVKAVGSELIGGKLLDKSMLTKAFNACPSDISNQLSCLTSTNWMSNIVFSEKIAITKRRSTTVFNRYNYTILEVLDVSEEWEATNYTADDFFPIFDAVFSVDTNQTGFNNSIQYQFVRASWSYLSSRINTQEATGADEGITKLRQLFAVPILDFNNVVFVGGPIPDDLGKTITLATVSYRVCF